MGITTIGGSIIHSAEELAGHAKAPGAKVDEQSKPSADSIKSDGKNSGHGKTYNYADGVPLVYAPKKGSTKIKFIAAAIVTTVAGIFGQSILSSHLKAKPTTPSAGAVPDVLPETASAFDGTPGATAGALA